MVDDLTRTGLTLGLGPLGRLMPMYLCLDPGCRIVAAGPTLIKLVGQDAIGQHLEAVFDLRRPMQIVSPMDLAQAMRLKMSLRHPPRTGFKGVAVPLRATGALLLNLSFGYAVREAVRDHALSDTDFAPTDLVVELLYLSEAKAAIMGELAKMNLRLREAMETAERQALTDPLTGLHNRRAMERKLALLLAARRDFALLHLDLDHFKRVNDTLGHGAGDQVLRAVAAILSDAVRQGDAVTRVGGDEFILLLPGMCDPPAVERLAGQILDRIRNPIDYQGQACRIAGSIGAVLSCDYDCPDAGRLLIEADRALYASKHAGRGQFTLRRPAVAGKYAPDGAESGQGGG
ncbi:MAG: GGDEF domain protein [Rhodobacteraceae bacterium HLUCCA12]|nr:MAG: GGDEF domain protein [Rhodobacteraceae bacterium HLUCCA12]